GAARYRAHHRTRGARGNARGTRRRIFRARVGGASNANRGGIIVLSMEPLADSLLPRDGRQSPTALLVARGTQRLLLSLGLSCIAELGLASGRRADLVALGDGGEIWIVEIKSSVEDFRVDQKWPDYRL